MGYGSWPAFFRARWPGPSRWRAFYPPGHRTPTLPSPGVIGPCCCFARSSSIRFLSFSRMPSSRRNLRPLGRNGPAFELKGTAQNGVLVGFPVTRLGSMALTPGQSCFIDVITAFEVCRRESAGGRKRGPKTGHSSIFGSRKREPKTGHSSILGAENGTFAAAAENGTFVNLDADGAVCGDGVVWEERLRGGRHIMHYSSAFDRLSRATFLDQRGRPHSSLGYQTPAEFAATCVRYVPIDEDLPDISSTESTNR